MIQTLLAPTMNFREASRVVLEYLQSTTGLALWMITRTEDEAWIVLDRSDPNHVYPVDSGDMIQWSDSYCQHMIKGSAPQIARHAQQIPLFAQSSISKKLPIGAYAGVPIFDRDGELFGTLCGIDPEIQSEQFEEHLPLIQLLARLLGGYLSMELQLQSLQRKSDRNSLHQMVDATTSYFNREGWSRLIQRERERANRLGRPSNVLRVDIKFDTQTKLSDVVAAIKDEFGSDYLIGHIATDQFEILLEDHEMSLAIERGRLIQDRLAARGIVSDYNAFNLKITETTTA
ncbi:MULTISPECIES: GAF domain-containing protein [Rhodopirellula]|uniref:GAF/GGDEF-domain-containing protein n=1 Tax=Rhodopirellula europaea SH398 TaxID=1263868 RepID=M5SNK2_9BACT|nr:MULTISPECIES: GAF domain-containing protein [Rhodopirellula]EMI27819.1 GAF/GGDEF-domain-containing protein [Rhodopirellula europaea SH398]MCR9210131.1 GAF domain-containing protein [bacterium]